ncbi:class I SAM-dependent methyltransferase [Nitrospiraceae bacterium AH_259_D15_M11_P09]|nr:class I SAM-dependent methyltransferase [Nitrospiraceae bacterium AH_259_D15_M11_P09]
MSLKGTGLSRQNFAGFNAPSWVVKTKEHDYVAVTRESRPFTNYPQKLASYLAKRYHIESGARLLDLGCGRGEFTQAFMGLGIDAEGADVSNFACKVYPDLKLHIFDLASTPYPFPDNCYDVVFTKSVLEHFYYPEHIMAEIHRLLKPGGLCINMVPDWRSNRKWFYDGFTHRTPFTPKSLLVLLELFNFSDIQVEKFRQLPSAWRYPALNILYALVGAVTPRIMSSKLIRFSKELMLLGTGRKTNE